MNFFKQLQDTGFDDLQMQIKIKGKGNEITVGFFPSLKNEALQKKAQPLLLTGTPEELDEAFFKNVNKFSEKIKGVSSNIEAVNEALQKVEEQEKGKAAAKKEKAVDKKAAKKQTPKEDVDNEDNEEGVSKPESQQGLIF